MMPRAFRKKQRIVKKYKMLYDREFGAIRMLDGARRCERRLTALLALCFH
jgi:hypothetical protein